MHVWVNEGEKKAQTNILLSGGSSLSSCRHMDDEQSLEIENSVLDRCIHHGGVVHIFVDRKSTYVSVAASYSGKGGRGGEGGVRVRHLTHDICTLTVNLSKLGSAVLTQRRMDTV